jgi:ribonucleoside-diphosphate reductase alpha chain
MSNSEVVTKGLKIARRFTQAGINPLDQVEYDRRSSVIKEMDGRVVFEMHDIEIPKDWTQLATDIIAQKYFRKAGVPLPDGTTGPETSARQVVTRMANCWRMWGERYGYFATGEDAQAFEDEIKYMLIHQNAAPNSPQWFNTGLANSYGITGSAQGHWYADPVTGELKLSDDAYTRPQPHACFIQSVNDDLVNEGGIFDLVTREARIFKYGSGTGTNFSTLRGRSERLSGGGKSSGLMSFLKVFDAAAGAIKSGGTTRRAAKMVCLDIDHPEIETFINWKSEEEKKVAALVAGSKINSLLLNYVMNVAKSENTTDPLASAKLGKTVSFATACNVPYNYIERALHLVAQGYDHYKITEIDTHYESDGYQTVSGQNSNNSVRVSNDFMNAVLNDADHDLVGRTTRQSLKTLKARDLWDQIATAAWASADPGLQYDTTINEWHTCPTDGRINASNPCSEYMFLDDTACNLASINLTKFFDAKTRQLDIAGFIHATRLWTMVLEISVLMAQFPSRRIAELSYTFRTLGLGYANLGTVLMLAGIPYDSPEALSWAGAITAIMCGESYATSAEMASVLGPFPGFTKNREPMLRVMRNHRRAAYNVAESDYEELTITPTPINPKFCPLDLLQAARSAWDHAIQLGEQHGYRNAQVTVIAPTGTIGLVMDCDTTGVEPDFALVKMKKLAGGGYFKIVNQSVPFALRNLGYKQSEIDEIITYVVGSGTLEGCPHLSKEVLVAAGMTDEQIAAIEKQLPNAFDVNYVFTNPTLTDIGLSPKQIEEVEEYVCGHMTIEGAPHLKLEHYPVFDCANTCGKKGKRFIDYMAHVRMMAAVQPFISGAISKTINMPHEATIEEVERVHMESWRSMLKAIALYRDGSKLSQPLNSTFVRESSGEIKLLSYLEHELDETDHGPERVQQRVVYQLQRQKLPHKRAGFTQEVRVGGHKIFLRTGEYEDGRLGEIFIDGYKDGAAYRSLLNCFAVLTSKALQYGIPLKELVDTFTFTRFEPAGVVEGHDAIKNSTSIIDFVFRALGYEYLGMEELVHVKDPNHNAKNTEPGPDAQKTMNDTKQTMIPSYSESQGPLEPINATLFESVTETVTVRTTEQEVSSVTETFQDARALGFTGDACGSCGSMKVKRNGTCTLCLDCGTTSGCS